MRKLVIPILSIGTILFICLLAGFALRLTGVFQSKEDVRAANFSLIMALKLYKQINGKYPQDFGALRLAVPSFDPTPFVHYRFDSGCIAAPSVCVEDGKTILSDTYPFGFCNFDLDNGVDFVCGDK